MATVAKARPGVDGQVHYSQLPFGVKQVDPSKKRLSLSLREVATIDPWEKVNDRYPIGKVVEATVDHGGPPGIFVQLEPA